MNILKVFESYLQW